MCNEYIEALYMPKEELKKFIKEKREFLGFKVEKEEKKEDEKPVKEVIKKVEKRESPKEILEKQINKLKKEYSKFCDLVKTTAKTTTSEDSIKHLMEVVERRKDQILKILERKGVDEATKNYFKATCARTVNKIKARLEELKEAQGEK